jgi:hypothetical protein
MSIVLPDLPPEPGPDEPWADRMRWIELATDQAAVRATIDSAAAAREQVAAATRLAELMQSNNEQPPSAPPAAPEAGRAAVAALLADSDKPVAESVERVQALIAGADALLAPGQ